MLRFTKHPHHNDMLQERLAILMSYANNHFTVKRFDTTKLL